LFEKAVLSAVIILIAVNLNAQTRKEIEAAGLKSKTTINVDYDLSPAGKETKDSYEKYDQNGNLIEYIEYDKYGKVSDHITYEYNENNDKITEIHYSSSNKITTKEKYIYDGKFKKEKLTYDAAGKLIKKKKYIYEVY